MFSSFLEQQNYVCCSAAKTNLSLNLSSNTSNLQYCRNFDKILKEIFIECADDFVLFDSNNCRFEAYKFLNFVSLFFDIAYLNQDSTFYSFIKDITFYSKNNFNFTINLFLYYRDFIDSIDVLDRQKVDLSDSFKCCNNIAALHYSKLFNLCKKAYVGLNSGIILYRFYIYGEKDLQLYMKNNIPYIRRVEEIHNLYLCFIKSIKFIAKSIK